MTSTERQLWMGAWTVGSGTFLYFVLPMVGWSVAWWQALCLTLIVAVLRSPDRTSEVVGRELDSARASHLVDWFILAVNVAGIAFIAWVNS
jgi:hypothetical protein